MTVPFAGCEAIEIGAKPNSGAVQLTMALFWAPGRTCRVGAGEQNAVSATCRSTDASVVSSPSVALMPKLSAPV